MRDGRRVALVTGGTDGIGKEAARLLAGAGHHTILVGRDAEKGDRTVRELRATSGNDRVEFLPADLALVSGAERLAGQVAARTEALHVLFHSAGGISLPRRLTDEGIEWNFALNYLTRFVLTRRLLPLLEAGGLPDRAARIATAGGAIRSGRIHYDDAALATGYNVLRAVGQAQHANDLWVVEQARRLEGAAGANDDAGIRSANTGPSVTIACIKYGAIRTNARRAFPRWAQWLLAGVIDPVIGRTAAEAGAAAARVTTDPALEGVTGALFELVTKLRRIEPGSRVADPEEGRRLWALSERLALDAHSPARLEPAVTSPAPATATA